MLLNALQYGLLVKRWVQDQSHARLHSTTHHHIAVNMGAWQCRHNSISVGSLMHQSGHGYIQQNTLVR